MLSACVLMVIAAGFIPAQGQTLEPVSYHKQIWPIIQRSCQGCHQPAEANGDLIMVTFEDFKRGGLDGTPFIPGKPDESLVIELISGEEPSMPKEGDLLTDEEVELFRRWIAEGAKDDTPTTDDDSIGPDRPPVYTVPPVISAVAYSPDGKTLAVSGFREVLLHKSDGSELVSRLVGKSHRIQSIVYTVDGKMLGAVGGSPGKFGEVQLWDTSTNTLIKSIKTSYDTVYGASFSPDGKQIAFGCADKTARIISIADAKEILKFENHSDWVFGTIFSTSGTHFVSCGRDTALKLVEVDTGSFVDDINSSNKGYGEINTIARHPTKDQVLSAGEDRIPRLYKIFREIRRDVGNTDFNLIQAYEAQSGSIEGVAFSADGSRFATGNGGGEARIYNVEDGKRLASMQSDAVSVFAVSFHPEGTQLATGGFDGKIRIFDTATGKLLNAFMSVPIEPAGSEDVALVVTGMT
jgi:WD40 repeat protein